MFESRSPNVNMFASVGREPSKSYAISRNDGPPASCSPSQPPSLQKLQITTAGWLRSRFTKAPMFVTYFDSLAKRPAEGRRAG